MIVKLANSFLLIYIFYSYGNEKKEYQTHNIQMQTTAQKIHCAIEFIQLYVQKLCINGYKNKTPFVYITKYFFSSNAFSHPFELDWRRKNNCSIKELSYTSIWITLPSNSN